MAAPRRNDWTEDLTDIFAMVPWWVPFALAAVAWIGVPPLGRALVDDAGWDSLWPSVRFLVVIMLLGPGVFAQFERRRRRGLHARAGELETLRELTWREFEEACAEAFRQRGHVVSETPRGADGGVDLILRSGGGTIFVQCKHYKKQQVGVALVRELYGVMVHGRATSAIFITTGTYTVAARDFARDLPMELIDGPGVLSLMRRTPGPDRGPTETPAPTRDADIVPTARPRAAVHDAAYRMADVRAAHPNAYARWTPDEEERLVERFRAGTSIAELARGLGRQPSGIRSRLKKLQLIDG